VVTYLRWMADAVDDVARALLAVADGRPAEAARRARGSGTALGALLADHLATASAGGVYEEPRAFEAFISGGGNVDLYAATVAGLGSLHARERPGSLVDLGCGDGRVTAAVIPDGCRRVDLVEPSAVLLAAAQARLAGRDLAVTAHATTLAGYTAAAPPPVDAAQATYALHTVDPGTRPALLAALAERVRVLAVAEFDVPAFADRSPVHAAYAAERYPRGLAEYPEGSEVGPGFLVPVLVAQFDPARPRLTWEQPVTAWVAELEAAGYHVEGVVPLHDYWWAPARLIVACPARLGPC
jgi:SAM-dependent methyltransferase